MKLFIKPYDVLFFRDNKPFPMGGSHIAKSLFPPGPGVFQGAIRSRIISDNGGFKDYKNGKNDLLEAIGGPDSNGKQSYGKLRIKGPIIAKKEESNYVEYFPLPLDISFAPAEDKPDRIKYDLENFRPLTTRDKKKIDEDEINETEIPEYIKKEELANYLKCELVDVKKLKKDNIHYPEDRVGIKLGDTGTAEEGMFYTAEYIRLEKGFGFTLYVSGVDRLLKDSGMLALGGKRRAAFFEKIAGEKIVSNEQVDDIRKVLKESDGFKLYLATPAIFKNGWKPEIDNEFELVTADIGKAHYIGGFDVLNNRPKNLRRAVPAGSVYYYRLKNKEKMDENTAKVVLDMFHEKCISEYDKEIGNGLCFVGGWKYV